MKVRTLHITAACTLLALAGLPLAGGAQSTQLNAPAARISDQAIQADQLAYESVQGRIKGLNDRGRAVRDYHLSKAQCWLDVSFHEYTRNDRGPFPQAALTEAEKLVVGMERGTALGNETPLVGEAVKLRPDLWERADRLKRERGLSCAAHKLACAEVELVHAGNEHAQQQWRHAKPYVQIAEDLMAEAEALARSCPPPAGAVSPAAQVAPAPLTSTAAVVSAAQETRELSWAAHVVFAFDGDQPADIRPHSVQQLRQLVARLQRTGLDPQQVQLTGHADRLNATGQADYNQRLSERRVQTVKALLVQLGIDERLIEMRARGDEVPIESCSGGTRGQQDLQECLLPNRRVDVQINARQKN